MGQNLDFSNFGSDCEFKFNFKIAQFFPALWDFWHAHALHVP